MKEISSLAALLKVILYDILGLLIPGFLLFALLLLLVGYCQDSGQPFELMKQARNADKIILYGMLIAAYALGYFLQSISAFHSTLFDDLGARLLHKAELETPALPSGTSSATRFVERFYTTTPFYQFARGIIAHEVGLADPK